MDEPTEEDDGSDVDNMADVKDGEDPTDKVEGAEGEKEGEIATILILVAIMTPMDTTIEIKRHIRIEKQNNAGSQNLVEFQFALI